MKLIMRLMIAVTVLAGAFYFIKPPEIDSLTPARTPRTFLEQKIEQSEDNLSRYERVMRLFRFKEAVTQALAERVPVEQQVDERQIPQYLKQALVATEDKRYYEHGAVDLFGIARALYINTVAGETVEGGSTITQQLVKNLFLSSKRIMSRKVEEVLLAVLMEHYYSKDEILGMYLNSIYYGNNYYGLTAAAKGYFGVSPEQLTLAQCALLAGLPQAPSYYNPLKNFAGAKERQRTVLSLMVQQGIISQAEANRALYSDLHLQGSAAKSQP